MKSGWLVVDKPLGITSTKLGSKLKRILSVSKIGHVGTLDPMASGVILYAIGEATKFIPYLNYNEEEYKKEYLFEVTFGKATDTFDLEGKVTDESDIIPSHDSILKIIQKFKGEIIQTPPTYSAIHINGKRAYSLARSGIQFDVPKRTVFIDSLELISFKENKALFLVKCSKGTYIRSLAVDIAKELETLGHISFLRRVKDGKINESLCLTINETTNYNDCVAFLFSIEAFLDDIPVLMVDIAKELAIVQGKKIECHLKNCLVRVHSNLGRFIGVAVCEDGVLHAKRLLSTC